MNTWLIEGIVAVVVLTAVFATGWVKGNEHGTLKLTNYVSEQAIQTVKLADARFKIVTKTETKYRTRIEQIKVKGDTIIKEVPIYVTPIDDAACSVSTGFVREYNAAWENTPAGPAAESDRQPSGVSLSTVSETDASNAKSCQVYKEQRDGLIEFYHNLQQAQ